MKPTYIEQLPVEVRGLIYAVAEQSLRYDGYDGYDLEEALQTVRQEKIVNVVGELTQFVDWCVSSWVDIVDTYKRTERSFETYRTHIRR